MAWGFYGRQSELTYLKDILSRDRWFFVKITGRRRIGKTALIQQALTASGGRPVYYLQIPDSGPVGVLSAAVDAMGTFGVDPEKFNRPTSLSEFAKFIASLARAGYVVALDEFQYFNRERLRDFCSMLQREVDALSSKATQVKGGLLVLGSLHLEMSAILEDRSAPLYNRTTDELLLGHLDTSSLVTLLRPNDGGPFAGLVDPIPSPGSCGDRVDLGGEREAWVPRRRLCLCLCLCLCAGDVAASCATTCSGPTSV